MELSPRDLQAVYGVHRFPAVHAGGSRLQDLIALAKDAGFERVETEEMPPVRFSAFPGAGFVRADKS